MESNLRGRKRHDKSNYISVTEASSLLEFAELNSVQVNFTFY